jgi:Ran-binding protein 3
MAQSAKSSSDEANAPQMTADQDAKTSRPKSPVSGGSDNDGAEKPVREKLKKTSIAGLSTHGKSTDDKVRPDSVEVESSAGEEEKDQEDSMLTDTTPSSRGRPTRKRSFDDLRNEPTTSVDASAQEDIAESAAHHKRMRSRDMPSTKTTAINGRVEKEHVEALAEEENDVEAQKSPGGACIIVGAPSTDGDVATSGSQSPKKKRSRDQFDKDHSAESGALEEEVKDTALPEKEQRQLNDEITRTNSISDKGEPDKKRHRDTSQEGRKIPGTESAAPMV